MWKIEKRYSEFVSMYEMLQKNDDYKNKLPPLHRKFIIKSKSHSPEVIKEREIILLNFLKSLANIVQTSLSPDIQALSFLGMLNTSYELDHIKEKSSIHISKLSSMAKPGDIVFFKCFGSLQQLQRAATGAGNHLILLL